MRRKDREIKDFQEMVNIVDGCHTLRLGIADGDFPYIVPVNFGYTAEDGELIFYIHGAMAGRKYEMLKKHPYCSFEMDEALEMDCIYEAKDVTMRYRSVMGKAEVSFLEGEEKKQAVDSVLMARYEETKNFEYNEKMLERTALMKLSVTEWSAKVNPVREK
ncbi:MAG: pyridoxamine 5'-phosphate oxidase family protein [Eubacteriales bacterium]|nr:pyridoxamine 5'-phosphate oxidase family protein [Eubacteriales bacterium]